MRCQYCNVFQSVAETTHFTCGQYFDSLKLQQNLPAFTACYFFTFFMIANSGLTQHKRIKYYFRKQTFALRRNAAVPL